MNSVTENEPHTANLDKVRPDKEESKPSQPGLILLPPGLRNGTTQAPIEGLNNETTTEKGTKEMPIRELNNGQPHNDITSGSIMMGKLCRRALALIKHKVGIDGSVSDHMA
jgi:hypothetical protein